MISQDLLEKRARRGMHLAPLYVVGAAAHTPIDIDARLAGVLIIVGLPAGVRDWN